MVRQTTSDRSDARRSNRLLAALADDRRRTVVRVLRECRTLPLRALADRVARREPGERRPDDAGETDALAAALHHKQLPILADAGLVSYDVDRRVAAVTERGRRMAASLDDLDALVRRFVRVPVDDGDEGAV